jgi:hypothetical protein
LLLPRSPAARHRQGAPAPDVGRFSPLNAPQRALVDGFIAEARPWAMRQARRAYRHLPAELHEQALDQAAMALRTGAPHDLDRRSLYADLAERLDEELRRIHIGWCLNQARVGTASPTEVAPAPPTPTSGHPITGFIEDALGGLERAVLQLELGAGRNSSTVRAALRLGPRQYGRHREVGLGKLRGAIAGGLHGQVCAQHLEAVTLAATGDRDAAERLSTGPERCRACAREAAGLRRVLQQRLALAPWPFAIKPVGLLAAKLAAVGTLLGGKGAASGGAGLSGIGAGTASGAKVVAAVIATAAVATGGIAALQDEPATTGAAKHSAATVKSAPGSRPAAVTNAAAATTGGGAATTTAPAKRTTKPKRTTATKPSAGATTPTQTAASSAPAATEPAATSGGSGTVAKPTDPVRKAVEDVKKTVDKVTGKLPVKVPPVDEIAPALGPTVDNATGTVDDLLTP